MAHLKEGFGDFIEKLATLYSMGSEEDNKEQQEKDKKTQMREQEREKEHSSKLKEVDTIQKKLENKLREIDKKEKELSRKETDISARERKHKEDALQRREDDIKNMLSKIEDQHGILTKQEQERAQNLLKKEKDKDSLIKSQKFDYEDADNDEVFGDLNSIESRLKAKMSQVEPDQGCGEEEEEDVMVVDADEDDILGKISSFFQGPEDEEEGEEDEEEDVEEEASPGTFDNPHGEDNSDEPDLNNEHPNEEEVSAMFSPSEEEEDGEDVISDTYGSVDILSKLSNAMDKGTELDFNVNDGNGTLSMDSQDDDQEIEGPAEDPVDQVEDEVQAVSDEQEEHDANWNDQPQPEEDEEESDDETYDQEDDEEQNESGSSFDEDDKDKILNQLKSLLGKKNDPDEPPVDPKTGKDILFGDEDIEDEDDDGSDCDDEDDVEEGFTIMPPIDRERYTDIEGLEGPFMQKSGKVLYYDPKEGKYYDRDSDYYLSDDEYMAHDTPRKSSFSQNEGTDILDRIKKAEKIMSLLEAPGDTNDMAPPNDSDAPTQQGEDPLAGPDAPIDDGSEPIPEEDDLPIEFEDKTKQIEDAEDYDLSSNNSYDYYDRIRGILNDEESIKALNQEYETIPMGRRKITPAKYLFDKVINNIKEKRKRSAPDDMMGGMGGMGADMGMGGMPPDMGMGGGPMGAEMGGMGGADMGGEGGGMPGGI